MSAASALPSGPGADGPGDGPAAPTDPPQASRAPAPSGPTLRGTGTGAPAGSGAFGRLVAHLREGGLPADARGMADALWLAQYLTAPDGRPDTARALPADAARPAPPLLSALPGPDAVGPDAAPAVAPTAPAEAAAETARLSSLADARSGGARARAPRQVGLLAARNGRPAPERGRLADVAVPTAAAFPGLLPLQRALRPIQRYQPPALPADRELDEGATAELSARSEMVVPVLRGVRRRSAGLRLLMDGSASMALWEQTLHELRQVCERLGAFRDVTVHYLHPCGDGVGVATAPGPDAVVRPAAQLHDPTGHHLTLVVSDCVGPLWRDGRMQRLLHTWVADAPVAVVQPLPQRMWGRTLLPAAAGTLVRRQGPYRALAFEPARRRRGSAAARRWRGERRERAVPVLSPAPVALGTWARLAAADAGLSLPGAAAQVRPDHGPGVALVPALGAPHGSLPTDPAARVLAFEESASPDARFLAVHLSAVPLSLPVIQVVQRAMLPHTGPAELAEVLLSGLVDPSPQPPDPEPVPEPDAGRATTAGDREPGGPWFAFAPGVRDELLSRLSATEAALVLKHCSLYIERTFGRGARNFPAVAVALLAGSAHEPETGRGAVPQPFARVSERVLRRFAPALNPPPGPDDAGRGPVADGVAFLERYEAEGDVRDLVEAVSLLRAAAETTPGDAGPVPAQAAAAALPLARALLHAWKTWSQAESLRDAEEYAGRAVERTAGPAAVRALLVLAEVRRARALERRSAEDAAAERAALRDAVDHLGDACDLMAPRDPRLAPAAALRAETLRRLAVLPPMEGSAPAASDPLAEAEHALTALLEGLPGGEDAPGALHAARGGVLLDRARRRPSGSERAALAVRAAADLEDATRLLRREGAGDRAVCAALVDLADARLLPGDGAALPEALHALSTAGALARQLDDAALEAACLRREAAAHRALHERTGDLAALDAAVAALAAALRRCEPDTPEHTALLVERGAALLTRAGLEGAAEPGGRLAAEAVHVLREALARVRPHDVELDALRLLFGRALRLRNERRPSLADLHEADYVLELAARSTTDPLVCAEAWLEAGDVQLLLDRRLRARERHDRAAACYRRAARAADDAGSPVLAARAHHRRAGVLEATAGPQAALRAYRDSWEQWQRAGERDGDEAARTRERMRALQAGRGGASA